VIFARQEAPDPVRSALRSLRPSLNTPVVVVEDLPTGPASAAIACLGDPAGSRVVLVVRSERSGQAIFFGPDDELRELQQPGTAVDAALSFAEGMGFLFEDDRVSLAPAEARRLWGDLLDGCARGPGPRSGSALPGATPGRHPSPAPPEPDGEELWLEEIAPAAQAVGHALPLTKFRRAATTPPRRPEGPAGTPAARHPIGRFRVGLQRRGR
jgi:hypothetical protein